MPKPGQLEPEQARTSASQPTSKPNQQTQPASQLTFQNSANPKCVWELFLTVTFLENQGVSF